jgi:hypothetical protein
MDLDYLDTDDLALVRAETPSERRERERDAEDARNLAQKIARSKRKVAARLAQGSSDYPLLVCSLCGGIAGWLGDPVRAWRDDLDSEVSSSAHACYECLTAYPWSSRFPSEHWLDDNLVHAVIPRLWQKRELKAELARFSDAPLPLWRRLAFPLWRAPYRRAELANWRRFVDGWGAGPCEHALDGFEKVEIDAPDKSGRLIVFAVGRYVFQRGRWRRLQVSRRTAWVDMPHVFSASLPIEQLASAWVDFQALVNADNARDWQDHLDWEIEDRKQKALAALKAEAGQELLTRDRGTVDLF